MLPTTGPEASLTVVLVAVPLFTAVETLLPRCFGARPDLEERNRHVRTLAIAWPILLVGALTLPLMARKARTELDMGSNSSPWYLWICAAVAGLFLTAMAVSAGLAARSEVTLRTVAAELLKDVHPLREVLSTSEHPDARSAHAWLDEAQEALDAGRGRTAVRYLRHAMTCAEYARLDTAGSEDAIVIPIPLDRIRQRVEETEMKAGPFTGPPLKA
jgi:small-conductance mechanosensitive channel